MHLWTSASNYMGKDYSDWYVLVSQTRDSNILEQSNFVSIFKHIGGESAHVQVIRLGHWACGWIEFIGIHKDAPSDLIKLGESIEETLASYPVFDETDYCQREWDACAEYWRGLPAWVRKRDYGATATEARRSFSWIARNAEKVYERVRESVCE